MPIISSDQFLKKLAAFLEQEGVTFHDAVERQAEILAHVVSRQSIDAVRQSESPYEHWSTLTDKGDELMEQMFQKLCDDLRNFKVSRLGLPVEITARLNSLQELEPKAGFWDTEPQMELEEQLNPVLDELGYKPIDRFDW